MTVDRTIKRILLLIVGVAAAGTVSAACRDENTSVQPTRAETAETSDTVLSETVVEAPELFTATPTENEALTSVHTRQPKEAETVTPEPSQSPLPTVIRPQEDPVGWATLLMKCKQHEEPFELYGVRLDGSHSIVDTAEDPALHPCLGSTFEERVHSIWSIVVHEDGGVRTSEGGSETYSIVEGNYQIPLRANHMDKVAVGEEDTTLDYFVPTPTPTSTPKPELGADDFGFPVTFSGEYALQGPLHYAPCHHWDGTQGVDPGENWYDAFHAGDMHMLNLSSTPRTIVVLAPIAGIVDGVTSFGGNGLVVSLKTDYFFEGSRVYVDIAHMHRLFPGDDTNPPVSVGSHVVKGQPIGISDALFHWGRPEQSVDIAVRNGPEGANPLYSNFAPESYIDAYPLLADDVAHLQERGLLRFDYFRAHCLQSGHLP